MSDNKDFISTYRKAIETTAIYQAGKILADARHSVKNALLVPVFLFRLAKRHKELERVDFKATQPAPKRRGSHGFDNTFYAIALLNHHRDDWKSLVNELKSGSINKAQYNQTITEVARIASYSNAATAAEVIKQADDIEEKPDLLKQLGFLMYRSGDLIKPAEILSKKILRDTLSKSDEASVAKIISEAEIFQQGIDIPVKHRPPALKRTKVMYVCHTSFPHHTNGYAVRTHNIAKTLIKQGIDIHCVSRPGYPWDRRDAQHTADIETRCGIDGVLYYRHQTTNATELPLTEYTNQATETLLRHIKQHNVSHVMAASNYVNALPALIASRMAGTPFIYDVRGLWEYTDASKIRNWEHTERFNLFRRLETKIANEADRVITISTQLREELISRGTDADKIHLALNATDRKEIAPLELREKIREELSIPQTATVLGFVGSIEKYEGLQNLAKAAEMLLKEEYEIFILIVGSGTYSNTLHEICCQSGIIKNVRFTGRVAFKKAQNYYSGIDICVYPRLADKVCNIVPPLKPLEAMAHKKPVVCSRISPIVELIGGCENALLVKPGDELELSRSLKKLINSKDFQLALANKGYMHSYGNRGWQNIIETYTECFPQLKPE